MRNNGVSGGGGGMLSFFVWWEAFWLIFIFFNRSSMQNLPVLYAKFLPIMVFDIKVHSKTPVIYQTITLQMHN